MRGQFNCPLSRRYASLIAVIAKPHVASQPLDRLEVILGHRRASSRYCLRYAHLVAANYIQISLNHHYEATFTDRLFGLAQRENMSPLIIQ